MKETITTKELAKQLGTRPNVITENARKCLPNKKIEHGKPTYWSKAEVTVLIEQLKCNQVNGRTFPNLSVELKGVERCERDSAITTMQFAKQLGTSPNVVLENARKCLPNKKIENGKPTYWTKEEVTILLDYMKSHTSNNRSAEFSSLVANTSTELTPALKAQQFISSIDYSDESAVDMVTATITALSSNLIAALHSENKGLVKENKMLKHQVEYNEVIGCSKWSDVKKLLGLKMKWEDVREKLDLEENVDYFKKCMGYDKFPTTLITDNALNRIKELADS